VTDDEPDRDRRLDGVDLVAIVLAATLGLGVLAIVIGAVVQIQTRASGVALSENVTQILIAAIGGIVGVLGSYIGYRARGRDQHADCADDAPHHPSSG
jgi:uncharacterized membrane protein YqgA involved in biofilm formation